MTPDEIRAALQDRRIDAVAAATGIHRNTIAQLRSGKNTNPTWETMRKLSEYLIASGGSAPIGEKP